METWRQSLYFLGLLANIAFMFRFLLQWRQSEKAGKPVVSKGFWNISILGNIALLLHSIIQIQYHVAFTQACNTIISWRNLDLIKHPHQNPRSWKFVLALIGVSIFLVTGIFFAQSYFFSLSNEWFRAPSTPWQSPPDAISNFWHYLGFMGLLLFASRFWIQWWMAERDHKSYLSVHFWWMSLIGALLCLIYFFRIGDYANVIGPLFGLIPYLRNIMLMKKIQLTNSAS